MLMQEELFNILKETSEYKSFKRKSRIRSIVALLMITTFWGIIVLATDFDNIDDASMIYFAILVLATLFLVKYAYGAFFKRPSIVAYGTITDVREIRRVVNGRPANEERQLETRVSYQYLIHFDKNDYWGDCVYDSIENQGKVHEVGESVLFFSISPGNNYIIKSK